MLTRTSFFFRGSNYVRYDVDPVSGVESVNSGIYPRDIGDAWTAMPNSFRSGIGSAVLWPDAFVYFFKGDKYVRWDATNDTVDASIYPRDISDGWSAFPPSFTTGVDAAINWGNGISYFFKGSKYIRYDMTHDTVDASIYPRDISDGWSAFPPSFTTGVDAAINWGNGISYFFKGSKYIRYDMTHDTVDLDNYPRDISDGWPLLAGVGFTENFNEILEWPQADVVSFAAPANFTACHTATSPQVKAGRTFNMLATMRQSHPALPTCGEYRQFVRGDLMKNGHRVNHILASGNPPVVLQPRPPLGSTSDNFLEDGVPASLTLAGVDKHYGHRNIPASTIDLNDLYEPLPRRTGNSYKGRDTPTVADAPGTFLRIDVDFRGVLIDACNGGRVVRQNDWTVTCEVPT